MSARLRHKRSPRIQGKRCWKRANAKAKEARHVKEDEAALEQQWPQNLLHQRQFAAPTNHITTTQSYRSRDQDFHKRVGL